MMISFLHFHNLSGLPGIKHFITTREGGVSTGTYRSLNLSYKSGDQEIRIIENRRRLAERLTIPAHRLYFPEQCHTCTISVLEESEKKPVLSERDGLITNQPNRCIAVLAADCVPVLLYDPVRRVIAAIHAGWRGTAGKIVLEAVDRMQKQFDCQASDILVGIGPAISFARYEVGDDVGMQFIALFDAKEEIISRNKESGRYHVDLQAANRSLLCGAGILPENIERIQLCTYSCTEQFFSARRDGFSSGRFATGIMLEEVEI